MSDFNKIIRCTLARPPTQVGLSLDNQSSAGHFSKILQSIVLAFHVERDTHTL